MSDSSPAMCRTSSRPATVKLLRRMSSAACARISRVAPGLHSLATRVLTDCIAPHALRFVLSRQPRCTRGRRGGNHPLSFKSSAMAARQGNQHSYNT